MTAPFLVATLAIEKIFGSLEKLEYPGYFVLG
jgi:hypothetical protein